MEQRSGLLKSNQETKALRVRTADYGKNRALRSIYKAWNSL